MSAMRQAEPYKADFTDEVLIEFLRRVCPQLSQHGDFYVQELWIEEKPTAWLLCLPSDQGPMIYNTSYDFPRRIGARHRFVQPVDPGRHRRRETDVQPAPRRRGLQKTPGRRPGNVQDHVAAKLKIISHFRCAVFE